MAKLQTYPDIDLTITITLNEQEARVLEAIMGYDPEAFLKVFKESLGSHYIGNRDEIVKELFTSMRPLLCNALSKLEEARKVFKK